MNNKKTVDWSGTGRDGGLQTQNEHRINFIIKALGGDERASNWQNIKDLSKYYASKAYIKIKKMLIKPR